MASAVRRELSTEGLPDNVLGNFTAPIVVAKIASRQLVGFMNEMARSTEYTIADVGGLARCDVGELNRKPRILHNRNGRYAAIWSLGEARARDLRRYSKSGLKVAISNVIVRCRCRCDLP